MSAVAVPRMSDRGRHISRTFAAAFEALKEHAKQHPAEVADIYERLAAHLRSVAPLTLLTPTLDTGPIARIEPPVNEIERSICADGKYRLSFDEGHLALVVTDEGDTAAGVLTPEMAETLRADIARVMGGR